MDKKTTSHEVVKRNKVTMKKSSILMALCIILAVAFIAAILTRGFTSFGGSILGQAVAPLPVSADEAGKRTVKFINDNLLQAGTTAEFKSAAEKNGLYAVNLTINDQEIQIFISKDAKLLFAQFPIDMNAPIPKAETPAATTPTEVPKTDKPVVELFVMTHCPYGTQAEKGIIPVIAALKDKADIKIRFVHYFMHGDKEETETYNQVCIRDEQSNKFIPYLSCFLNASDSARCINEVGIDKTNLGDCVANRAKDIYNNVDSGLSQKYGVQGSPTLVINGVEADFYPRSPSNALKVTCAGFTTSPNECSAQLSAENPSPGFGYGASSVSGSSASCVT